MATVEQGAKEILRIAVHEQRVAANGIVPLQPVAVRFNTPPWRYDELMPAVLYAQAKGWLTQEGHLTAAGYAAAVGG